LKTVYQCDKCKTIFDDFIECLDHEKNCKATTIADLEQAYINLPPVDNNLKDIYEAKNCLQCENYSIKTNVCRMFRFTNLISDIKNCEKTD